MAFIEFPAKTPAAILGFVVFVLVALVVLKKTGIAAKLGA